jgi:hypothetical protein
LLALLADSVPTAAQFFDGFDSLKLDPENPENGWFFTAGKLLMLTPCFLAASAISCFSGSV